VAETERLNSTYRRKFKAKWLSLSSHALGLFALSRSLRSESVVVLHVKELSFSGKGWGGWVGEVAHMQLPLGRALFLFFLRFRTFALPRLLFVIVVLCCSPNRSDFCKLINNTRHTHSPQAHTHAHSCVHHASARFEISKAIYLH